MGYARDVNCSPFAPTKLRYRTEESSPRSLEPFEPTTHSSSHSQYVLKATDNDKSHLALCHDEFRGPLSSLCRSGGIGSSNNNKERCTLNLTKAQTTSRWCSVVVRRGSTVQVSSLSLDHDPKRRGPSPKALM
ncbi:hypothetical protein TNCV_1204191 [Trichonephila clavipes]|nr:hypothetical protein TNCV_1204191 [Trichonephila clavipes]